MQDELKQYWPGILHSAREILQKIAGEPESNLDNLPKTIETAIVQENKFEPIAAVDTIDDLFFWPARHSIIMHPGILIFFRLF